MTEIAYMVREDWAQNGTAMVPSSTRVREWLGDEPYLFAVTDVRKFNDRDRNADLEAADYISPRETRHQVSNIADLGRLGGQDQTHPLAAAAIHPYGHRDCDALRVATNSGPFERMFVMVWSPIDDVRPWLDGCGAVDLHIGISHHAPDRVMVAAAEMIVNEEYNGLSSGRGKDAVIQLLGAFARSGFPLDQTLWLRAYFAAGGTFQHADSIAKFVREMKSGVRHRTRARYRDDIVEILRREVRLTE